ncbi:predicted protein [Nematostella vectensis]|uniref:Ubiquitin carboxyl-terminal hydrolase MINDY n=2 Tax=Nematostella vectensis TaxID=45351 RepID=A7SD64_NEMVE|nr:probable ubiquitin carboxyl-terminal hydrolase MINDY-4 isoform X2 [Nematostella vectensis]EDO38391.1 predicted protein [Nematostella vectensis]|eukprot:XP_001630454.1 predicted protein [Nematostella vectensis]
MSNETEGIQDRTGILERWSRVFDNSFASSIAKTLPKTSKQPTSDTLELEDVFEEVVDEVPIARGGCRHPTESAPHQPNRRWAHQARKKSLEQVSPKIPGRSQLTGGKPAKAMQEQTPKIMPSRMKTRMEKDTEITTRAPSVTSGRPPSGRVRARVSTPPKSAKQAKPASPVKPVIPGGTLINLETAQSLRTVLFGTCGTSFNSDWRKQHINFSMNSHYGLSFYKPGPAGVLACLQAFLIKNLLYFNATPAIAKSMLQPMSSDRQRALVAALSQMMWQAGERKHAVVTLPCGEFQWLSYEGYKLDHLTENLMLFTFSDFDELQRFIKRQVTFFESTSGDGCILLLYSIILSRTTKRVTEDLSEPNSILLDSNNGCSQAMMNLLLTGRATKNVFNGDVEYNKRGTILAYPQKGIKERSEIGFLTLWEHIDSKDVEVGSKLKTPKFPVWVVDSTGGRYGVVFCLNKDLVNDWRLERRFELYYYNGTTRHSGAVGDVITVDTRDIVDENEVTEDTHPVEHCLRTKWPGAVIEWSSRYETRGSVQK